jgi:hypothetical protein
LTSPSNERGRSYRKYQIAGGSGEESSDAQELSSIPKRQRWFETREGALLTMKVHTGNKPRIADMLVTTPS